MKEETGYTAEEWEYLGYVDPNSAFLDNRCHHWVARNVVLTSPAEPDKGENLLVSEMNLEEIRGEIATGRFRHSLAIAALAHLFDLRMLLKSDE